MTKQFQAITIVVLALCVMSAQAQTSATASSNETPHRRAAKKKAPAESAIGREIRELREQLQTMQTQIDSLKQQNADKDAKLATQCGPILFEAFARLLQQAESRQQGCQLESHERFRQRRSEQQAIAQIEYHAPRPGGTNMSMPTGSNIGGDRTDRA